jgi:hypothetical protein
MILNRIQLLYNFCTTFVKVVQNIFCKSCAKHFKKLFKTYFNFLKCCVLYIMSADVAELSAALDSFVEEEDHHLVIVSTKLRVTKTQFKQMFYSRGDDYFQVANVYECPDDASSVKSSVWGIEPGVGISGDGSMNTLNYNKLGGRHNDPDGTQHAYGYMRDPSRTFFAQHEVMGYLEKDTCVKRDAWTACSRMSIQDQLYGLAFASETDQDLCLTVTCARRWSEVEDALAESCEAIAGNVNLYINVRVTNGLPKALDTIIRVRFIVDMGTRKYIENFTHGLFNQDLFDYTHGPLSNAGWTSGGVVLSGNGGGEQGGFISTSPVPTTTHYFSFRGDGATRTTVRPGPPPPGNFSRFFQTKNISNILKHLQELILFYIVGTGSNGGESPDTGGNSTLQPENLVLQVLNSAGDTPLGEFMIHDITVPGYSGGIWTKWSATEVQLNIIRSGSFLKFEQVESNRGYFDTYGIKYIKLTL